MNQPPSCIVRDATGAHYQWVKPHSVPLTDPGDLDDPKPVRTSRLGGWYTLTCRPVPPEQVTHPVSIVWGQPEQIGEAA